MAPLIISVKNIPELFNKYSEEKVRGLNPLDVQENMIEDCYIWAAEKGVKIITITAFPLYTGINIVIAYQK